ncbi:acetoacetate decarboxylase family protein [Candidatus Marimicrobium litorale]|uniref:Acetoacetate decarboxylase n=1 Tax=Candidatus Marimicrobium litorale TaxID=2518991 RepID=A0ABT3T4D2_9GAMM|nr:acetoacetate decarboxylase family protein [Candidatus Marimicrobium litorale]MCX2977142.1 acetoacetate decarboxylase [Candidatus Marimicrobium litorale]
MKLARALQLLSRPKLLLKIKNSKSADTGSPFVKSYKDLMKGGRPTADFYNAEMLNLFWETSPEAIATLLPPPLQPASKPVVAAFIAHYPETNFSVPYHESAVLIRASYKGEEGWYCLSMPVTDDMAMAGGREGWGYPKKMADISFSREDDTVTGYTERHGIKFMQVKARLSGKVNNDNAALDEIRALGVNAEGFSDKSFLFKHSPSPVKSGVFDYPPLLVEGVTRFRPKTFTWAETEIDLTESAYDPWNEVPVKRMLGGFYTVGDNSMLHGRVLQKVNELEFLPYAFLKWEFDQNRP